MTKPIGRTEHPEVTHLRALLTPVRARLLGGLGCQAGAAIAGMAPFVAAAELCRRLLAGTPMTHGRCGPPP